MSANVTLSPSSMATSLFSREYLMFDMWDEHHDPRTGPYYSGGPWGLAIIVSIYLSFVLYFGPKYMANRKPFELRQPMKIYNLVNVVLNSIMFGVGLYLTRGTFDCWGCKDGGHALWLRLTGGYGYMALKIFDLLDTVFFVLRKKTRQITPLHLIHHSVMPFTAYGALKYAPNNNSALTLILNTGVHTVMYYYYYLAALGPDAQKSLWWKKYITSIQLIQFAMVATHAAHIFLLPGCVHPRLFAGVQLIESVYFLYTFSKFYKKSYIDKNSNEVSEKTIKKLD